MQSSGGATKNASESKCDPSMNDDKTQELIETVQIEIRLLKEQIQEKQNAQRQKKLATKYHQVKFFERQKLTRMERKIRKKLEEAKQAADFEDVRILTEQLEYVCMNQLYVAFYPNDTKYLALFANGDSGDDSGNDSGNGNDNGNGGAGNQGNANFAIYVKYDSTKQQKITEVKRNILMQIKDGSISHSALAQKSWVNIDVLKKRNFDVSLADFYCGFQVTTTGTTSTVNSSTGSSTMTKKSKKMNMNNENDEKRKKDDRLVESQQLDISNQQLNDDVNVNIDNDQNLDADSDSDDSSTSSDSSSSSSSSSTSSSDSSNSNDSDTSDRNSKPPISQSEKQTNNTIHKSHDVHDDSDDDFLVDEMEHNDVKNAFLSKSSIQNLANEKVTGDKSKGWHTQKQRPGEWKGNKRHKRFP